MMSVWQCLLARIVEVPSARCVHVSGVDGVAIVNVFCLASIASTFGDAVASVARRRACRPGPAGRPQCHSHSAVEVWHHHSDTSRHR